MIQHLPSYPNVLKAKDIQRILKICKSKTYDLIHSNVFPVIKIGRDFRIPEDSFLEWFYETSRQPVASSQPAPTQHSKTPITMIDPCSILCRLMNGGSS